MNGIESERRTLDRSTAAAISPDMAPSTYKPSRQHQPLQAQRAEHGTVRHEGPDQQGVDREEAPEQVMSGPL
ncbi:MAG: hypothetical protein R2705_05385 [Ilumatobacteraceae bacterium]